MNWNKNLTRILLRGGKLTGPLLICVGLAGCTTTPESSPSLQQQAQADLVVSFQSWNAIVLMKPDITDVTSSPTIRPKTYAKPALVKLLHTLKMPKGFVVVILDQRGDTGAKASAEAMDAIQTFFQGLGFHRIAFHDSAAWNHSQGMPILRDSGAKKSQ